MSSSPNIIVEKVTSPTSEQFTEIDTFIEFIRYSSHDHELTKSAAAASSPAFETIWDYPEDTAYDAI